MESEEGTDTLSKKEARAEKKRKRLVAEFQLSQSNDEMKRPGELLASADAKKLKIDSNERLKLSPEEFKKLKKLLADRKKVLMQIPRFFLQGAGLSAALSQSHDVREPLFMSDVQQLLLYALGGNQLVQPPTRWCNIQKVNRLTHTVTLVIEGISSREFFSYEHLFPKLTSRFEHRTEFMAPVYYGRDVVQELSCIPLSNAQKEAILKKYGSMEKAVTQKEIVKQFRPLFPTMSDSGEESVLSVDLMTNLPVSDVFPRTYLLLGMNQMARESFPLPFRIHLDIFSKYASYKFSKSEYKEVTNHSQMFSIDCEMCETSLNPNELTRIAVINEELEVVYETLVKPKEKITNYKTRYSGITEDMLKDVTTTIEDVQRELQKLLPPDAILVGQSLNFDLHAIKMMHPYIIDTSVIFNVSGIPERKPKLSHLSYEFLKEEIQTGKQGHCPIEDAKAAMKLVKLKLSQGFLFGDFVAATDEPAVPESVLTASIFNRTYKNNKTVAVIGPETVLNEYQNVTANPPDGTAFSSIPIKTHEEVINKVAEVATSHQLTIAHLDVSDHIEGSEGCSVDKATKKDMFKKIDDWCEKVWDLVSINGLCVIVFGGPKNISQDSSLQLTSDSIKSSSSETDDSESPNHNNNNDVNSVPPSASSKSSSKLVKIASSNQTQPKVSKKKSRSKPRRNGVCFVQLHPQKV